MNKKDVDIFDTLSPDDLMIKVNVEDERPRKSLVVYISDEAGSDSQRISYLKQLFYSNSGIPSKVYNLEHLHEQTGFHIDITDIQEEDFIRVISRMMCCYLEKSCPFREIRFIRNKSVNSMRMRLKSWEFVKQYKNLEEEITPLSHFIYGMYPGNMSYQLIIKRICQRCRLRTSFRIYLKNRISIIRRI
jgi:hypothetical protein